MGHSSTWHKSMRAHETVQWSATYTWLEQKHLVLSGRQVQIVEGIASTHGGPQQVAQLL